MTLDPQRPQQASYQGDGTLLGCGRGWQCRGVGRGCRCPVQAGQMQGFPVHTCHWTRNQGSQGDAKVPICSTMHGVCLGTVGGATWCQQSKGVACSHPVPAVQGEAQGHQWFLPSGSMVPGGPSGQGVPTGTKEPVVLQVVPVLQGTTEYGWPGV